MKRRFFQWYSVKGIGDQNRTQRIIEARKYLDERMRLEFTRLNYMPERDKLIVVGFSQGAIMALDLVTSNRIPMTGVVSFSGRLIPPKTISSSFTPAAMLIHGINDEVIQYQQSEDAAKCLRTAGVSVENFYEAGLGHKISERGKMAAGEFITRLMA
jgi:phospholipase/carboxylesterase